jgi:hypothetical protein
MKFLRYWIPISFALVFAGLLLVLMMPDKWDRAIAIKVCGGLPIVKLEDGSVWLRYRWRYYRVEDWTKVC